METECVINEASVRNILTLSTELMRFVVMVVLTSGLVSVVVIGVIDVFSSKIVDGFTSSISAKVEIAVSAEDVISSGEFSSFWEPEVLGPDNS
jgi:hypothetical protein